MYSHSLLALGLTQCPKVSLQTPPHLLGRSEDSESRQTLRGTGEFLSSAHFSGENEKLTCVIVKLAVHLEWYKSPHRNRDRSYNPGQSYMGRYIGGGIHVDL